MKEPMVQIACLMDVDLVAKLEVVKKEKGKRTGWIVREAVKRYLDDEIKRTGG